MVVQPYLSFEGRCEEAVEFYKGALGAKVMMLMRFKESPDPRASAGLPPEAQNKVLHAAFQIGDSIVMASDGRCGGKASFQGIMLSLTVADAAEADRCFGALSTGGQVLQPLGTTFFSPRFGMVTDRFGVSWMVLVMP
jgi:PhnB protein